MHKPGADTSSVRRWNEQRTLEVLSDGAPRRVAELAFAVGITTAGMRDVLRTLTEKQWVTPVAISHGSRGRPAQEYQMLPLSSRVLGLDIGGHTVRAILRDDAGAITYRREVAITQGDSPVEATRDAVRAALSGVDLSQIWSTGLALSGVVSDDGRIVRSIAMPHFEGERPQEILADLLPGRVQALHDTKAALWAEAHEGAAVGEQDVLLLLLGRRPSLALLLGGRLHHGAHGSAGELSLNELIRDGWSQTSHSPGTASSLVAGVDAEPDVVAAHTYLLDLAPQIALATGLIDPSLLVIGGSLAPVLEPALPEFEAALAQRLEVSPRVVTTNLDQYAAVRGAHALAVRALWRALVLGEGGVLPFTISSLTDERPTR